MEETVAAVGDMEEVTAMQASLAIARDRARLIASRSMAAVVPVEGLLTPTPMARP